MRSARQGTVNGRQPKTNRPTTDERDVALEELVDLLVIALGIAFSIPSFFPKSSR